MALHETDLTWARTRGDLRQCFRIWGIDEYKALAKTRHPDKGGSIEAMAELNAAIERIRQERGDDAA